ncbi:MAG: hypothetical protein ACREQZ_04140 [Woeseiaceae bacterium]
MNRATLLLFALVISTAAADATPISVDSAAKRSESAGVGVEIVFKGVAPEGIVFDVAFDTMTMDAPPFDSDLSKRATLAVNGGAPIAPSSWTIRQTGHMGHHLRGRLVFPPEADGRPVLGPEARTFEVRLAGAQGEPQGVFTWNVVGR